MFGNDQTKQKVMYIFVRETKTKTKSQNPDKNNTAQKGLPTVLPI